MKYGGRRYACEGWTRNDRKRVRKRRWSPQGPHACVRADGSASIFGRGGVSSDETKIVYEQVYEYKDASSLDPSLWFGVGVM